MNKTSKKNEMSIKFSELILNQNKWISKMQESFKPETIFFNNKQFVDRTKTSIIGGVINKS